MTSTATAIGEIIRGAAEIEHLLVTHRQASGKGLHEKASTAQPPLADDTLKKIRFIASVRNKSAHDPQYVPDDLPGYLRAVQEVRLALEPPQPVEAPENQKPARLKMRPEAAARRSSSPERPASGDRPEASGPTLHRRPAPVHPARVRSAARARQPARHASLVLLIFPLTVLAALWFGVNVAGATSSLWTGVAAGMTALAGFFVLYAVAPGIALLSGGLAGGWVAWRAWALLSALLT
ncbi:hypothetical protein [Deinococcus peraridilitoris]|uniref:DUF4145 domain-containing protein n=1 Tax=Deinococcus peraridilitoris (strain DSM 19664 / LMG 22246 / CIP 109416 / KR-200) TaxID=937777 RepID=L0A3X5_DEIPD|nr:hypothetical protein [Deinococcus peraridilitoris]AFZ68114.1 hypothetical protein Deipe_2649 [Deinococcus peraridilitoris DSM 19664]